ncbi:mediator of RNA polymerase II transcription subunit 10 [Belonocnema kinseyi]|uniref:mediator of RNA polymerase II transcription subunit 10 n=1 Tax=Belonocnema kinseyi TaxID=2817044 RepID=UPI00143D312A|nr:mediator of RNA polymerase II transcription subunit 10 [Belonocnema kinseyi]
MASPLEDLELKLELFIENMRLTRIVVSDFQPQGQNVLNQKIQGIVTGLQEIDKLKSQVKDVHVPLEVFDYIDQGKNPQLYTKDCLERALSKNEETKGKIDGYKKLKANLLFEFNKVLPNDLAKYRAIRGDE